MFRRVFVLLFRRALVAALLLCLGCAAQSSAPELNQRIERQVRATFQLPATVNIKVLNRKPSPDFPGYDTLTVELSQGDKKKNIDFLISKDNQTMARVTKMDLSKDPYAEIMNKINTAGRPVLGNPGAKVTIVNYDDFQCPFCSRMHELLMSDIAKTYGDRVRIIYKDYPLSEIHPWAIHAAVDANCLAAQSPDAYWDFANYAHSNQKEITGSDRSLADEAKLLDNGATLIAQKRNLQMVPLQSCMKAQNDTAVKASLDEGNDIGVSATPTMFVNGEKVDGLLSPDALHAVIDRALHDANQPAPATAAKK
jgi:protein-disulfide isomerase